MNLVRCVSERTAQATVGSAMVAQAGHPMCLDMDSLSHFQKSPNVKVDWVKSQESSPQALTATEIGGDRLTVSFLVQDYGIQTLSIHIDCGGH
jgi:hypothetical protein